MQMDQLMLVAPLRNYRPLAENMPVLRGDSVVSATTFGH